MHTQGVRGSYESDSSCSAASINVMGGRGALAAQMSPMRGAQRASQASIKARCEATVASPQPGAPIWDILL